MSWHTNRSTGNKFQSRGRGVPKDTFNGLSKQDEKRIQAKVADDPIVNKLKNEKEQLRELIGHQNKLVSSIRKHESEIDSTLKKVQELKAKLDDHIVNELSTTGSIEVVAAKTTLANIESQLLALKKRAGSTHHDYLSIIGELADLQGNYNDATNNREVGIIIREENRLKE